MFRKFIQYLTRAGKKEWANYRAKALDSRWPWLTWPLTSFTHITYYVMIGDETNQFQHESYLNQQSLMEKEGSITIKVTSLLNISSTSCVMADSFFIWFKNVFLRALYTEYLIEVQTTKTKLYFHTTSMYREIPDEQTYICDVVKNNDYCCMTHHLCLWRNQDCSSLDLNCGRYCLYLNRFLT